MSLNFSGQVLRGHSFRGQNLQGADFSYANLRSVDFQGANLTAANFRHVQTGRTWGWTALLLLMCLVMAGTSGLIWAEVNLLFGSLGQGLSPADLLLAFVLWGMVALFYRTTLLQGFPQGAQFLAKNGIWVVILAWATPFAGAGGWWAALFVAAMTVLTLLTTVAMTLTVSVASALTIAITGFTAVILTEAIAMLGAIPSVLFGVHFLNPDLPLSANVVKLLILIITGGEVVLAVYGGWQALSGQSQQRWIEQLAVAVATWQGTNFQGANLTDADFAQSNLRFVDWRYSSLVRTHWQGAIFTLLRPGQTYLRDPVILQLVTQKQGQGQNYQRQFLQGVNLQGANLQNANFSGAILNDAQLRGANLTGAILQHTQLAGANLTGATLTGAYLENWGVTGTTCLDQVKCHYIYLRVPTAANPNPHRKPDNYQATFRPGEFSEFIKPITDTLDLYHTQGVDPHAIALAYQQLEDAHPDSQLQIVALEKRGVNLLIRVKTSPVADRSQLNADYFQAYHHFQAMAQANQKYFFQGSRDSLPAVRSNRASQLAAMITTVLQKNQSKSHPFQRDG
ncbi:pentapeptide repeat-containing protein [Spirulina sp. CS-785/01]|uniref:pentapeptide repeat-containing protein n=1 Tax=Spirulina sp. CS-785/01 TaxID=3021716 RepID=UPI00232B45A3|nr:pentapeptide repeat-containing protein [Spirulina sp. CS-785/01]MDB9313212.1 pentapeptide repeat-containing protein [Spirulina sp. CS-785/01]